MGFGTAWVQKNRGGPQGIYKRRIIRDKKW